jgi:carboxypeptidase T
MPTVHVNITGRSRSHLAAAGPKLRALVVGFREDEHGAVVDAFIRSEKIGWLKRKGYGVKVIEEIDAHDRSRRAEGKAAVAGRLKRGRYGDVIWGGGYLTADEIEAAMVLGEKNHADYFERIELPLRTWQKRTCHAFRIGTRGGRARPAVCFLGGVHGREWGGPDILIYFAVRLLRAYRDGTPLRVGRKHLTAAQVRRIVETIDIVVFPQVNPDGRHFSMNGRPMWRKNRRPAPPGRGLTSFGVDINRNFPFMWRFDRYFAPGTVMNSFNSWDYDTYVGPREASEPETRNVIWLLDQFPKIRWFVDLHSYGETILHSWGTDANQSKDPKMNFKNPAHDGKRGKIKDDAYGEYIPAGDLKKAVQMARRMSAAIRLVRGREYKVKQSVGLYPTSGATDDYAYSRHLIDPKKGKIIPFTIEWGRSHASTPFHPPYREMRHVMRDVTAGLLEMCLRFAESPRA